MPTMKLVETTPDDPDRSELVLYLRRVPGLTDPDTGGPMFQAILNGSDVQTPIGPHAQLVIFGLWEKLSTRGMKLEL